MCRKSASNRHPGRTSSTHRDSGHAERNGRRGRHANYNRRHIAKEHKVDNEEFDISSRQAQRRALSANSNRTSRNRRNSLPNRPPTTSGRHHGGTSYNGYTTSDSGRPKLYSNIRRTNNPKQCVIIRIFPSRFIMQLSIFNGRTPPPRTRTSDSRRRARCRTRCTTKSSQTRNGQIGPNRTAISVEYPVHVIRIRQPRVPWKT